MDVLNQHRYQPSAPVSPTLAAKEAQLDSDQSVPTKSLPLDSRQVNLELLREQLKAAKIPLTKRASINELPQNAVDCQFVAGTHRCSLALCEDSCTQSHTHHRTHARAPVSDALVYSRPSISLAPGSGLLSSFATPNESPAASEPASQTNSPQAQYRRASAFGFNIGGPSHRGSIMSTMSTGFSAPPSPLSHAGSGPNSAPQSPRPAAVAQLDFTQPIAEEITPRAVVLQAQPAAKPTIASASALPASAAPVAAEPAQRRGSFWRLRNHLINLRDYIGNRGSKEAKTRQDLAAAPRDDWADQEHPSWDPRSPQPPSPVEQCLDDAEVVRVNEGTNGIIEYELRPQQQQHQLH